VAALGFNPRATSFEDLVKEMVFHDVAALAATLPVAKPVTAALPAPAAEAEGEDAAAGVAAGAVAEAPAEEWGPFARGPPVGCVGCAARVAALEARMQETGF
jgi:hypothetical protein